MTKPIQVPLNVPIIGSRPPPEVMEQQAAQAQSMEALWPLTPFPLSANGVRVPAYWMGQTLLDAFALKAMEALDWNKSVNNGPKAVLQQAQRAWLVATAMMEMRPVGRAPHETASSAESDLPSSESSGTADTQPESSSQESGQRLVIT